MSCPKAGTPKTMAPQGPAASKAKQPPPTSESVPAKKPRLGGSEAVDVTLSEPDLPQSHSWDLPACEPSRLVYQYVRTWLSKFASDWKIGCEKGIEPHRLGGLGIGDDKDRAGGQSFKSPYLRDEAEMLLSTTGMYESGCNILWLNPFAPGLDLSLMGSWKDVQVVTALFNPEEDGQLKDRVIAPTHLEASVPQATAVQECWEYGLQLYAGHLLLWGWYVSVFRAIQADNRDHVRMLMECARTWTVRMTIIPPKDISTLFRRSMLYSEAQTIHELLQDTFIAFSTKCIGAFRADSKQSLNAGTLGAWLKDHGEWKFRGSSPGKTMTTAMVTLSSYTPEALSVVLQIERLYGKRLHSLVRVRQSV